MPAKFELIAPCFFGCESTANFELRRIGAEDIRVSDGRLTFQGGADMIAAANLNLRTVERVMLLLNTYPATTFDELFDGVYSIPWEELLPADAAFPVSGSSLNSQLSSVPACQSIIKKAVVKRLMQFHHTSVLPETGAEYKIRFMLRKNVCEIMLDTTGEGLHKRGYRRNAMEAPIRETLAATIADLGRVRRDSLVEDPFCGSGTLLIEAAQKAMNIAPASSAALPLSGIALCLPPSGQSSARKPWPIPSWMSALRPLAMISTPPRWLWPTPTPSWPVWKSAATLKWPMWLTLRQRARPSS